MVINNLLIKELYNTKYKSTLEHNSSDDPSKIGRVSSRTERQGKLIYSRNTKNGRFKSVNSITNLVGESLTSQRETFFRNNVIFNKKENGQFNHINVHSSSRMTSFTAKKISTTFDLPIGISLKRDKNNVDSYMDFSSLSTLENMEIENIMLTPNYRIEFAKYNTIYKLMGKARYLSDNSVSNYASTDSLFYQILENKDLKRFEQSRHISNLNTEHQLRITHKINKFKIVYNSIFSSQNENIKAKESNLLDPDFTGTTRLKRLTFDNAFFLGFDGIKIHLQSGLKQLGFKQNINDAKNKDFGINPYLFAMYKINHKWNISASFDYTMNLPSINQLTKVKLISGLQQLENGDLPIRTQEERKVVKFSVFKNYETGENSKQFNLSTSYTLPYTFTLQQPDPSSTFLQTSWQVGKMRDETTLNFNYSIYRRKWNYSLRLNSIYRFLEVQHFNYGQLINSLSASIKYKTKRFSSHSALRFRNTNTVDLPTVSYNNIHFVSNFEHEYKKFKQSINLAAIGSAVGNKLRVRPILSLGLYYPIPKRNLELSLVAANVNNLKNNIVSSTGASLQSIHLNENTLQSGNIMIFIKKLL